MKQKQVEQGIQPSGRQKPQMAIWMGCLMGILSGILIVIGAAKLYMNETRRLEWYSQTVEARQVVKAGQASGLFYDRTYGNETQNRIHGVRK